MFNWLIKGVWVIFFFFLVLAFGPGQLTSLVMKSWILYLSQPSSKWDYSTCNKARLVGIFQYLFLLQAFDPNEWCLINGPLSVSGGSEPTTSKFCLNHKTTATRLAFSYVCILIYYCVKCSQSIVSTIKYNKI